MKPREFDNTIDPWRYEVYLHDEDLVYDTWTGTLLKPDDKEVVDWVDKGGAVNPPYHQPNSNKLLLFEKLKSIDRETLLKRQRLFEFNGNNYYPDIETIQAYAFAATLNPNLKMLWKTADKEEDGVSNIYVELDSNSIIQLAQHLLLHLSSIWVEGDKKKTELKEEFKRSLNNG